jgi:hypothetical protein
VDTKLLTKDEQIEMYNTIVDMNKKSDELCAKINRPLPGTIIYIVTDDERTSTFIVQVDRQCHYNLKIYKHDPAKIESDIIFNVTFRKPHTAIECADRLLHGELAGSVVMHLLQHVSHREDQIFNDASLRYVRRVLLPNHYSTKPDPRSTLFARVKNVTTSEQIKIRLAGSDPSSNPIAIGRVLTPPVNNVNEDEEEETEDEETREEEPEEEEQCEECGDFYPISVLYRDINGDKYCGGCFDQLPADLRGEDSPKPVSPSKETGPKFVFTLSLEPKIQRSPDPVGLYQKKLIEKPGDLFDSFPSPNAPLALEINWPICIDGLHTRPDGPCIPGPLTAYNCLQCARPLSELEYLNMRPPIYTRELRELCGDKRMCLDCWHTTVIKPIPLSPHVCVSRTHMDVSNRINQFIQNTKIYKLCAHVDLMDYYLFGNYYIQDELGLHDGALRIRGASAGYKQCYMCFVDSLNFRNALFLEVPGEKCTSCAGPVTTLNVAYTNWLRDYYKTEVRPLLCFNCSAKKPRAAIELTSTYSCESTLCSRGREFEARSHKKKLTPDEIIYSLNHFELNSRNGAVRFSCFPCRKRLTEMAEFSVKIRKEADERARKEQAENVERLRRELAMPDPWVR